MKHIKHVVQLATYILQGIFVAITLAVIKYHPKTMFNLAFDAIVFLILWILVDKVIDPKTTSKLIKKWIGILLVGAILVFFIPMLGYLSASLAVILTAKYLKKTEGRKFYLMLSVLIFLIVISFQTFSVANISVILEE